MLAILVGFFSFQPSKLLYSSSRCLLPVRTDDGRYCPHCSRRMGNGKRQRRYKKISLRVLTPLGDTAEHRYLPFFFSWSYVAADESLVPIGGIIFCGITSVLLAALPFNFLIQLYLIIRLVNLFSEYAALIWLRFSEPETPRPYKIPGGVLLESLSLTLHRILRSDFHLPSHTLFGRLGFVICPLRSIAVRRRDFGGGSAMLSIQKSLGLSYYQIRLLSPKRPAFRPESCQLALM